MSLRNPGRPTLVALVAALAACGGSGAGPGASSGPGGAATDAVAIASLSPAEVPSAGGSRIAIEGRGFAPGMRVSFGDSAAADVTVESPTHAVAVAPRHGAGPVDVLVSAQHGDAHVHDGVRFVDPPVVSFVDPGHLPQTGGTVILHGHDFAVGARVLLGADASLGDAQRASDSQLVAVAGPHAPGAVDVTVVNPDGQQGTLPAALRFDAPATPPPPSDQAPSLASLSPATGPETGGTVVALVGSGFDPLATVRFGGAPATVTAVTATTLTTVAPPHPPGAVDVVVANPDGQLGTLAAAYTYVAVPQPPPVLSSLAPASGPDAGGTSVVLAGTGFQQGAAVTFGGASATVLVRTATSVTVLAPAHPAGVVDVVVSNLDSQRSTLAAAYTYVAPAPPPPSIAGVTPSSGPLAGGNTLTVSGASFQPGATVTVGGASAAVTASSATSLAVVAPPHAAGVVGVSVTNPDGQAATLAAGYTYLAPPPPAVSALSPTSGPDLGGAAVTLAGSGFVQGASVTFGGTAATVLAATAGSLTVTAPAHAAGAVDVVVTNPDGQRGTLVAGYAYLPPPQLAAVAPASGPVAGGTRVTLAGSGFQAGATVAFGGAAGASALVGSASIAVTTPPHAAGATDVVVTNPDGRQAVLAGAFTFVAPAPPPPAVSGVSPPSGTTQGGTSVVVAGVGFDAAATVGIGGAPATVSARSATALTVLTPAHAAGAADVTVVNGDGQSSTLAAAFTFVAPPPPPPSIAAVAPPSGPTAGGNTLVVSGASFRPGATVTVGGASAAVTASSAISLTVVAPPHAAGVAAVTVTNPDGQAATLAAGYTYLAPPPPPPALLALAPVQGPDAGGTLVTLTGQGFGPGAAVTFGGTAAIVSSVTPTSISAVAPAHVAGVVDVAVTNADGQASTLPAAFTFVAPPPPPPVLPAPVVAGLVPASGPTAGGTVVALTGAAFQPGASVTLGGASASVVSLAPSSIALVTPPHAAGAVDVTVTNPDGQRTTLAAGYAYVAPPALVAVAPAIGLTTGGGPAVVSGSGFRAGATVTFGGVPAAVTAASATSLTVTIPAHAAGAVDVAVANPDGQGATLAAAFTYVLPPPAIAAVAPGSGSTLGGTAVTVSGSGFQPGAGATLGGAVAPVLAVTATGLTLSTPAHAPGPASLTVTNPDGQSATLASAFTFVAPPPPPPRLSAIAPAQGPDAGGTAVTLSGAGFLAGATVRFGGTSAPVVAVTATSVSALTPPHLAGPADVTVTNPDGQSSTLAAAFTFVAPPPPPVLASVLPSSGPVSGGTPVALSGASFQAGATVSVGGAAAAVQSVSPTAIALVAPAHAAGAVDVTVTNPDGRSTTLPASFTYLAPPPPPPALAAISPISGPVAGGGAVTLTGSGFASGATVTFGGVAATVTASTATSLSVTAPPHAAGAVDVVVVNPDGRSATLAAAFAYLAPPPPPALASLAPASGPAAGGTAVVLAGTAFSPGATVRFGGAAATVTASSATSLSVTTPAHAAGLADVVVTNPDGQASTLAAAFTYVAPPPPPALASVTPATGTTAGGTAVVLAGTGFASGATVTVGGVAATVGGVTATALSVTTPAHAAGLADVVVTNPDGQASTLAAAFTYVAPPPPPVLASVAPASGVATGGDLVILAGTGFATGASVTFGGARATVSAATATSLSVVTPAGVAGVVDVVVTNPDGQASTLAGAFTYVAPPPLGAPPIVTSLTPGSGLTVGGTTVVVAGKDFVNAVVWFGGLGGTAVAPFTASATSLGVVTPPHAAGVVDVVVQNADGQTATLAGAFTYVQPPSLPPPAVTGVSPASGPVNGNTVVTVAGTGFVAGATVTIAGVPAIMGAITATTIVVTTPGGPAGPADVTVVNPDRQAATLVGGFTYVAPPPVVTAINVRGSPQAGGGLLLFAGSGLSNTVSVTFGGVPATGLTYDPLRGALTVTVPPSPFGPTADVFVDLVLTNLDGQSTTWPNFHYGNPPAPASFTPTTGPKGTAMTITGTDFSADATGLRAGLQVSFGGTLAVVTAKSPTQLTVTVPKLNPGVYQVFVTNFDSQLGIAPGTFTAPGP